MAFFAAEGYAVLPYWTYSFIAELGHVVHAFNLGEGCFGHFRQGGFAFCYLELHNNTILVFPIREDCYVESAITAFPVRADCVIRQ